MGPSGSAAQRSAKIRVAARTPDDATDAFPVGHHRPSSVPRNLTRKVGHAFPQALSPSRDCTDRCYRQPDRLSNALTLRQARVDSLCKCRIALDYQRRRSISMIAPRSKVRVPNFDSRAADEGTPSRWL